MTSIASAPFLQWPATKELIATLQLAKINARFVGGCVRDALLDRAVHDVDLASPTEPDEALHLLQELGLHVIPTGIEHGTITIVMDGAHFELTTLRRDVDCDGRHAIVAYTDDWKADAKRRDFTINALYADMDSNVFDYHDGLTDLKSGDIKFIGEAKDRIKEDALRILRLFRFQAQLGFAVDDALYMQCKKSVRMLGKISAERICSETMKLLATPKPTAAWHALFDYTIAPKIYDDLLARPIELILQAEKHLLGAPLTAKERMALLALLAEYYEVDQLKSLLKLSNEQTKQIASVLEHTASITPDISLKEQRKWRYTLGENLYRLCVIGAASRELRGHTQRSLEPYLRMLEDAKNWQPPKFDISGTDLMALGYSEGAELGNMLKILESTWIDSGFEMNKGQLLTSIHAPKPQTAN